MMVEDTSAWPRKNAGATEKVRNNEIYRSIPIAYKANKTPEGGILMTDQETYQIIRQNVIASHYDETGSPDPLLNLLQADGSFSDLDYNDRKWGDWHPGRHLSRIVTLCKIHITPKNPHYRDGAVREAIKSAIVYFLDGWLADNFRSDNWWHATVNIPIQFRTIALLFRAELEGDIRAKVDKICEGNDYNPQYYRYDPNPEPAGRRPGSGWRLFYMTHIYVSTRDEDPVGAMQMLRDCIKSMDDALSRVPYASDRSPNGTLMEENGTMNDYSYLQHEKCAVPHSYGMLPVTNMARILEFWRGSDLTLTPNSVRQVINWFIEGMMHLSYRGYSPMMLLGREVTNAASHEFRLQGNLNDFASICDSLLQWDITEEQREKLLAFRQRCIAPDETPNFTQTKYFWCSETLTHHRPDWYFCVHGVSTRLKRPESCCNRNVQGMFLGDGCYNLMQSGMEYGLLGPAMDWSKLPGVTGNCETPDRNPECEIDTTIDTERIFGGARGTMPFVGGLAEENVGFFAMDYHHLGTKAKKAYFCTEDRVLCLGTEIATEPEAHAYTTLDQCRLAGDVWVNGEVVPEGDHRLTDCDTVFTNGIGYVFLQNSRPVELANHARSGNWMSVDPDSQIDAIKEENIFLLGMDHGKDVTGDAYAYLLLPRTTLEKTLAASKENPLQIVENSAQCQVVWDASRGLGMAVCYAPASFAFGDRRITVEKECTLLFRDYGTDWTLQAADPLHREGKLTVTLTGASTETVTFDFKAGYRSANLGRPLCYDSRRGILPLTGAKSDGRTE